VEARFSATVQTGPGAHTASCTMSTESFPGVKRPGRGVDHPPPSSTEVKERVELYLYSPSGLSWPVVGRTLPLLYTRRVDLHILCARGKFGCNIPDLVADNQRRKLELLKLIMPIPVAVQSKAWVCGLSLTGIVGSNPS
jgi:hypothetical protein